MGELSLNEKEHKVMNHLITAPSTMCKPLFGSLFNCFCNDNMQILSF